MAQSGYPGSTTQADRSKPWKKAGGVRHPDNPELATLAQAVSPGEFQDMLAQWQRGEREVRIENGFLMTCYTPPE
jgi:hypothetical protein